MGERPQEAHADSRGSFEEVAALGEAAALANIALRVPYKRLLWDAKKMEFTNSPEANKLVRRERGPARMGIRSPADVPGTDDDQRTEPT